ISFFAAVISGALLGLAFEFRYQTAIMSLGLFLWMLIIGRFRILSMCHILFGIILVIFVCVFIDWWGYGKLCFAPWNYLRFNIVEGKVNQFDIFPWWDYFRTSFTEAWPLLGFILLLSFCITWIQHYSHILTWTTLPFFVVHCAIAHKEIRFIFPIATMGPLFLTLAANQNYSVFKKVLLNKQISYFLAGFNMIALIGTTLSPVWMPVRLYEHIYNSPKNISTIYSIDINSFNVVRGKMNFYKKTETKFLFIENIEFIDKINKNNGPLWLFHKKSVLPKELILLSDRCKIEFSFYPIWFTNLNFFGNFNQPSNWSIFECR
ncbi:MAG: hypothetical protein HY843_09060, partial [Bdellovibrio sp.]|nr:hypothetical protein [Bdellovibrio sp.]